MKLRIADLHCHYPMHLLTEVRRDPSLKAMTRVRERRGWTKVKATILLLAARLLNFRRFWDKWRVSLDLLEEGEVRLALSVLYLPFSEMDADEWPDGDPEDGYYDKLLTHLRAVEDDLRGRDAAIVTAEADLDPQPGDRRTRFVHCVEGGFHLGKTIEKIEPRVKELADKGVAYITLAHLFWRHVATNAPAIPFLTDGQYDRLFPQPDGIGLTDIGRAAVRAMHKHGILIDISHMRQAAIEETFELLAELDKQPGREAHDFPVIATHAGFRFSEKQSYMLSRDTIEKIAGRGGVIGLIMAHHQLNDNLTKRRGGLKRTLNTVQRHIDMIYEITESHAHVGIGSDLDGFIKPTVGGIEYANDLQKLVEPLSKAYPGDVDAILYGNALGVLHKAFALRR